MEDHQLKLLLEGIEIQTSELLTAIRSEGVIIQNAVTSLKDPREVTSNLQQWKQRFLSNIEKALQAKTGWGRNELMELIKEVVDITGHGNVLSEIGDDDDIPF